MKVLTLLCVDREVSYETATEYPALVRVNSVSHSADIHLSDP
ncbi:DUF5431 family protein [Lelliottia sp. WAP21]